MKENNIATVLETLAEKIRELQVDLSFARYERDELRKENAKLKGETDNG